MNPRTFITTAAAALVGSLALAGGANAATIPVTTTADTFEAGNGDGLCSVREAIETAVTKTNQGGCGSQGVFTFFDDVVEIPAGLYKLTIPSDGGNPNDNATGSLGLEGQGVTLRGVGAGTATLDANNASHLFTSNIGGGSLAAFENLVLQNGKQSDGALVDLFQTALRIHNSTLTGGQASDIGGAVHTFGTVDIRNSTFTGNSANEGGGALYLESNVEGTIANSTITANNADADNDGGTGGGLVKEGGAGELTITNSIISGNLGGGNLADCSGTVTVSQNNLYGSNAGTCDGAGDLFGQPNLAGLADNGGKTPTMALLAGSPALDKGVNCLPVDQRGVERFLGGTCDLGAYELVTCEGQPANRIGTESGETITGTEGNDVVLARGGDDTVNGLGGSDLVCAGDGNDTIDGGDGDDRLLGENGNDNIIGGAGNDTAEGGAGEDSYDGGAGDDTGTGGEGNDAFNGGDGKDRYSGEDGNDNAKGGAGNDSLSGQAGKDSLNGGAGKDKLNGGAGKDKLKGAGGKDKCIGSGGKDSGKSCEKQVSIP